MAGLKESIRAADDIKWQDVDIPEWGSKFRVKGLPSGDWEQYQNTLHKLRLQDGAKGRAGAEMTVTSRRAEIVAKALHDPETGERIFTDLREGIAILSRKNAGIVGALFALCHKLSDQDRTFEEQVQAAEEDFADGQG